MQQEPQQAPAGTSMRLPPRLEIIAAGLLRNWFLECDGAATLDASQVEVVTTPALQVLMAGRDRLRARGHAVAVADPSPAFRSCLRTLGCDLGRLTHAGGMV